MFLIQTTLRATLSVCVVLVISFVVTGFVTSGYRRERASLGSAHFVRAQALTSGGELSEAIEEYRQALIFSPDETEYRLSLARALINAKRLDEAMTHLEQLLQEDPTNGMINLLLARVAAQRHDTQQAIEYYERAVYEYWSASQVSARREARWELARLLEQTGKRSQLIAELMQLYANAPAAETKQIAEIGFRLLDTGATSEASQVFHDLARNSPRNGDAHRGLGEVAFRSGDYEAARHEFQRAVRLAPADQQNAQQLALTNEVIGLDPGLAHISSIERLRRSRNLLTRVLKDLEACLLPEAEARGSQPPKPKAGATAGVLATGLQQRLEAARRQLLPDQHGDADDRALQVQDTAEQLWRDRSAFCESNPVADRPLDIVVLRLRYE